MQSDPTDKIPSISSNQLPDPAHGNGLPQEEFFEGSDAEAYAKLKAKRAERRRKKLIRRGIALGICVVLVAIGFGVAALLSQSDESETEAEYDFATQGTYTTEVSAKGTLKPLSSTVISPSVDGTISEVKVVQGQTVNAGDTLLVMKNDDLDREVTEAQNTLKSAQAELASAQTALKQASVPQVTYDEENNAITTPGDTVSAQEAVNSAQRSVDQANSALEQARAKAAARTVTSPAAGSIVDLNAQVGASVTGGSMATSDGNGAKTLMQVADLSQMKVTIQVSEEDIAQVAQGQTATVTFPAFSDLELEGNVQSIASIASNNGSEGSGGVTFDVEVLIPQPDARLKPGMTAQVKLQVEKLDNVVMVPTTALKTEDGQNYYVEKQSDSTGKAKRVDVTIVTKNEDNAVIGRPQVSASTDDPNNEDATASLPEAPLKDGDTLLISNGSDASSDTSDEYSSDGF